MLLVTAMALTIPVALAQTAPDLNPRQTEPKKPAHLEVTDNLQGEGIIIDNSGNLFKGHYNLDLIQAQSSDNTTESYMVKRGQFIINGEDLGITLKVNPDSWAVSKSQTGYTASGDVVDIYGKTFKVSLDAKHIRDVKNGSVYQVDGTFNDGSGVIFELHYYSVLKERQHKLA